MENCYGPPSEHQSIYSLQTTYSLVAGIYNLLLLKDLNLKTQGDLF